MSLVPGSFWVGEGYQSQVLGPGTSLWPKPGQDTPFHPGMTRARVDLSPEEDTPWTGYSAGGMRLARTFLFFASDI